MLQQLSIQNYAIITGIDIHFSGKLNMITGETGAGKSILMGALSLILGERADTSLLQNKEKKCVIEGTFKTQHSLVRAYLDQNDFEGDEEIVIRREIAPSGKSRAFVNDTPVNLNQLKELSSLLVDLHQQFDTLELGNNDFQRAVIDALANHSDMLAHYQSLYKKYVTEKKRLEEWRQQQSAANKELDYHKFLFNELDAAGLKGGELEEMDASLKVMSNAENIKAILSRIFFELQENEQPVVQQLKSLSNQLQTLSGFHQDINSLVARLHSAQIELQDIADEIDRLNDSVKYDAEKINVLNERLALGYRLLKKHNVQTTTELLLVKEELEQKLAVVVSLESNIAEKEKEVTGLHSDTLKIAEKISASRQKQKKPFEQKVNELLAQVGMPNARLQVEIKNIELNLFGLDTIEFLFDANKSNRFEPLRKVASGGELSRLMLSIKSLVAKSIQLPTLIFDEIDTGISGEAARQVGIIMKDLSAAHQVIAITHQPQIAAKATSHFFVYKEIRDNKIVTSIKLLSPDERISAIATMLSGERPTAAAFENAREMIGN